MAKIVYLESYGSVCKLHGENKKIEEILKDEFTQHFIPDLKVSIQKMPYDIEVNDEDIPVPVQIDYPEAHYQADLPGRDIISLCEYLLERTRQEKSGVYSLNSATASKNEHAVTFFAGATNSGKTSSMIELIKNHGFNFYCDEHSLIDPLNKKIVGGSRSIATRKTILKDTLSNDFEFYPKNFDEGERDASLFVYPHLDHGLNEPIHHQFSPLDFHWLLSREFGGIIRGVVKFADDFKYPLPSLDTQKLSEERIKKTIEFTKNVPCYYFQGSLEQIAEFVKSKLQ